MPRIATANAMTEAGRSLQLIRDFRPRDHCPLHVWLPYTFEPALRKPPTISWDHDKLMEALLTGKGRQNKGQSNSNQIRPPEHQASQGARAGGDRAREGRAGGRNTTQHSIMLRLHRGGLA